MSFQDPMLTKRVRGGEAPFDLGEVFFSRTDPRGVISAGNHVFSRVANFPLEEMLGAPHKIIRHPEMPKGVFWLLWDTIKKGSSIGAYVKNRASDGCYYWVFAVVTPTADGYLSARIKPSSPLLKVIEQEYAAIRKAELEDGLDPEGSAMAILEVLKGLGFASYHEFCNHALTEELLSRDKGLGRPENPRISELRGMMAVADKLFEETGSLVKDFQAMSTIPQNLRVIASRIEPAGGPVTVLSQNYSTMSREMSHWFEANVMGENSNFRAIKGTVDNTMFVEGMVRILQECDEQLTREEDVEGQLNITGERLILKELVNDQWAQAVQGLAGVRDEADRIKAACTTMERHFMALSTTRVLCKIECARLAEKGEALETIIEQLGEFQDRIAKRLTCIADLGAEIRDANLCGEAP